MLLLLSIFCVLSLKNGILLYKFLLHFSHYFGIFLLLRQYMYTLYSFWLFKRIGLLDYLGFLARESAGVIIPMSAFVCMGPNIWKILGLLQTPVSIGFVTAIISVLYFPVANWFGACGYVLDDVSEA